MFVYVVLVVVEIFDIYCRQVVLSRKPENLPKIASKTQKIFFQFDDHPRISPVGPF